LRKNIVGGGIEDIYQQAFRIKPEEFDESFDKWLKERFKPFRDKQRPSDYGKDLSPDSEKTAYTQVYAFSPSPSGEIVAALTGKTLHRFPIDLDQAQSPCLLPDGRYALFAAIKEGISDIYLLDLEGGSYKNLTQDSFHDSDPQVSPDGSLVVYTRRVSGHDKIYTFPLGNATRKTQLTFGPHDDS